MRVEAIEALDLRYGAEGALHVLADGTELYYELRGRGPALTLVSTIYVVSTAWRNFTRELVGAHRILAYDLRNQGASAQSAVPFEQHVDDLRSLLDAAGIERTYLLGTSISTLICRDFAVAHPERVAGVVLVGPSLSPWRSQRRRRIVRSWLAVLEAGGPEALFDLIYPIVFGDRTIAEGGSPAFLALRERFLAINSHAQLRENLSTSLSASDDPELLRRISCPVLLMVGDDDFTASQAAMEGIRELVGQGRVDVLEGCGHLPYYESTARFERSVAQFVAAVESGALAQQPPLRRVPLEPQA